MESRDFKAEYANFLKGFVDIKRPLKVVFDATNGPTGLIVTDVFAGSPTEIILINNEIDPDFKAHSPNPLLPGAADSCIKAILEHNADLGVISDADGDRAFFLDEKGEMIPACFITELLGKNFTPPFVVDELVYESLRFLDLMPPSDLIPSRIGAYFIKKVIKEGNYTFGAEYSGHYYFKDFFGLDSGLFATLAVLNSISRMDMPISRWKESFGEHEIATIEISTEGKDMPRLLSSLEDKYGKIAKKVEHRDGVTFIFDNFWANIRGSNTEPILRIVAGGNTSMHAKLKEIEEFVRAN